MPRPCSVCAHLDRSTIDIALAQQVCNVRALGKVYGLGKDALYVHRRKHLPAFLEAFTATDTPPLVGMFSAEYKRLYLEALDQLARAQTGTLERIDDDGTQHFAVSNTAVARAISEARKTLDSLVRLAADAGAEDERPQGMANGELTARIQEQLRRVVDRSLSNASSDADAAPLAALATPSGGGDEGEPGGLSGEAGAPSSSSMSLDAVMPVSTAQGISPVVAQVVRDDRATSTQPAPQPPGPVFTVPNPRYPGSAAATSEERAASGYPDIQLTVEDLKSRPELLAQIAERL